jgi:hypothetical protein
MIKKLKSYLISILILTIILFIITFYLTNTYTVNCKCGPCLDGNLLDNPLLKYFAPNSKRIYAKHCNFLAYYLHYLPYWIIISIIITTIFKYTSQFIKTKK